MAVHSFLILVRNVKQRPCWLSISMPSCRSRPLGCPSDLTGYFANYSLLASGHMRHQPAFRTYSSPDKRRATSGLLGAPRQCILDGFGELCVLGGPPMGHNPIQLAHSACPFISFSITCHDNSGISTLLRIGHHISEAIPWLHARLLNPVLSPKPPKPRYSVHSAVYSGSLDKHPHSPLPWLLQGCLR